MDRELQAQWAALMEQWLQRAGMTQRGLREALALPKGGSVTRLLHGQGCVSVRRVLGFAKLASVDHHGLREAIDLLADMGSGEADALRLGLHSDCWDDLLEVTP